VDSVIDPRRPAVAGGACPGRVPPASRDRGTM